MSVEEAAQVGGSVAWAPAGPRSAARAPPCTCAPSLHTPPVVAFGPPFFVATVTDARASRRENTESGISPHRLCGPDSSPSAWRFPQKRLLSFFPRPRGMVSTLPSGQPRRVTYGGPRSPASYSPALWSWPRWRRRGAVEAGPCAPERVLGGKAGGIGRQSGPAGPAGTCTRGRWLHAMP